MHTEPLLAYVLRRLEETKGQHKDIARDSGVPYSTLTKIFQRVTPNPGVLHVQRLADYFKALDGVGPVVAIGTNGEVPALLPETVAPVGHAFPEPVHDDRRADDRRHGERRQQVEQRKADRRKPGERRDGAH